MRLTVGAHVVDLLAIIHEERDQAASQSKGKQADTAGVHVGKSSGSCDRGRLNLGVARRTDHVYRCAAYILSGTSNCRYMWSIYLCLKR